jgi:hypothetical protein
MASTENTCIQLKKLIDILMFKKKKPEFGAYFKFMIVELLFIFVASIIFVFTSALKKSKNKFAKKILENELYNDISSYILLSCTVFFITFLIALALTSTMTESEGKEFFLESVIAASLFMLSISVIYKCFTILVKKTLNKINRNNSKKQLLTFLVIPAFIFMLALFYLFNQYSDIFVNNTGKLSVIFQFIKVNKEYKEIFAMCIAYMFFEIVAIIMYVMYMSNPLDWKVDFLFLDRKNEEDMTRLCNKPVELNKKDVVLLDKECLNNITDEILNTALYGKFFAIFLYILVYYNNNHLHLFSKAKTLYKKAKSIDYKQLAKNTASAVKNKAIAKKDAIKKKVTNTATTIKALKYANARQKLGENLQKHALKKTEGIRKKVKFAKNVRQAVEKGDFKNFAKGQIQSRIKAKKESFLNKVKSVNKAADIASKIKVS